MELDDQLLKELCELLKRDGERILQGEANLAVTADVLRGLNIGFTAIIEKETTLEGTLEDDRSKYLLFLYDFIQKTPRLKIFHGHHTLLGAVNVNRFRRLTHLELKRIPIHMVNGLGVLRSQLKVVKSERSAHDLDSLLEHCGGDRVDRNSWLHLARIHLNHNRLESVGSSLRLVPRLEFLDLSHNQLKQEGHIKSMSDLKVLNLNYNLLTSVPSFIAVPLYLQEVYLRNNNIKDLKGADVLVNLRVLDVACNCITSHKSLQPLSSLIKVEIIDFTNNPLFYFSNHRALTASYLHQQSRKLKVLLDNVPLTQEEKQDGAALGFIRKYNTPVKYIPPCHRKVEQERNRSFTQSSPRLRHTPRARRPVIVDSAEEDTVSARSALEDSIEACGTEHLHTKAQLEKLREEYGGENWLHHAGGNQLTDILGLPEPENSFLLSLEEKIEDSTGPEIHEEPVLVEVEHSSSVPDTRKSSGEGSFYKKVSLSPEGFQGVEWRTFSGQKREGSTKSNMLLKISNSSIEETDPNSGQRLARWNILSVTSARRIGRDPCLVMLTFDTLSAHKDRTYEMEPEDCDEVVNLLAPMALLQALKQTECNVLNCMKCQSVFSSSNAMTVLKERGNTEPPDEILVCPHCSSDLVVEMESAPLPAQRKLSVPRTPNVPQNTPILNEGFQTLQVTAQIHTEPQVPPSEEQISFDVPVITKGANDQESENPPSSKFREKTPSGRSESDVELLSSYTSQSSIEVLSEDRKSLNMVEPDTNLSVVEPEASLSAPTLSTSSGSPATSVCTEYALRDGMRSSATMNGLSDLADDFPTGEPLSVGARMLLRKDDIGEGTNEYSFTWENLRKVDHRLVLYCDLKVFQEQGEEFEGLVRVDFQVSGSLELQPGILVISSQKLYLLKMTSDEQELVENWVTKYQECKLSNLEQCVSVIENQGCLLVLTTSTWLLLFHDQQRTESFKSWIRDHISGAPPDLKWGDWRLSQQELLNSLLPSPLTNFSTCYASINNGRWSASAVAVCPEEIMLLAGEYSWLMNRDKKQTIMAVVKQPLTNIAFVRRNNTCLILQFQDEDTDTELAWKILMVTDNAADTLIESIAVPWEEAFDVELQVGQ